MRPAPRARASAAATTSRPGASRGCSNFSRYGHDGGANKTGTLSGVSTLGGYADTSRHGRVRFVISLGSNNGGMRFRLLRAIESGL